MGMWTLASARQNSMCKEIEPSDEMMIDADLTVLGL